MLIGHWTPPAFWIPNQTGEVLLAVRQHRRDGLAGAQPAGDQRVGHPVGAGVHLAVAHARGRRRRAGSRGRGAPRRAGAGWPGAPRPVGSSRRYQSDHSAIGGGVDHTRATAVTPGVKTGALAADPIHQMTRPPPTDPVVDAGACASLAHGIEAMARAHRRPPARARPRQRTTATRSSTCRRSSSSARAAAASSSRSTPTTARCCCWRRRGRHEDARRRAHGRRRVRPSASGSARPARPTRKARPPLVTEYRRLAETLGRGPAPVETGLDLQRAAAGLLRAAARAEAVAAQSPAARLRRAGRRTV